MWNVLAVISAAVGAVCFIALALLDVAGADL